MLDELYAYIFHRTADGILIASPDGVIEHVNPAAAILLGKTVEQLCGQESARLFHNNPALLNLLTRPGDQTLDVRLPRRRLAVGVAAPLTDGGRIVLLQDVTEQRDLESRRESLISTMKHDLRNPLSAVSGFAELLDKMGDLNDRQQHFLLRLRQTTHKLYEVIGTLTDLAWLEAGMPLQHLPIHLGEIIDSVITELSSMAQEKQITLALSVQDPIPGLVGDTGRIRMVIYHLLHNAILYSEAERVVVIHAWGDAREVYCSVADQGFGIADDEVELVFDRLYRSKDERVRDLPGGGLGLTLARRIVLRHGGDIWAASNLGKGSTFTFLLPAVYA
jgi:signal transduction histidine kinase